MSLLLLLLVPPPVVTAALAMPVPGGALATIWVSEINVKSHDGGGSVAVGLSAVAPKATLVTPVKFVPSIVTSVPPAGGPKEAPIDVTLGPKLNLSLPLVLLVPDGVVTTTSTSAVPAGDSTVIVVALTETIRAALSPKATVVAPVKFLPVTVTPVPPRYEP